jgi:cysteinyl-tRNA synthetase
MKTPSLSLLLLFLVLATAAVAESTLMDRLRRAFDTTKEKVGEAAQTAGRASKEFLVRAKENLRLSRPEYTRRASERIAAAAAVLQKVKQGRSGVMSRIYFQTRLVSLDQHLDYARREIQHLQASPSEEVFRERQGSFDFTLWSLEEVLALAESEAGY